MRCDKCKSGTKYGHTIVHEFGQNYNLCAYCSMIYAKIGKTGFMKSFLDPKFTESDEFPLGLIDRNIMKARERRGNNDRSLWQKCSS